MNDVDLYNSHNIAILIKKVAKEKNITIKTMLSELGLGSNTMSAMYHGKAISSSSLAQIADYLDCSVDYLLGRTNCPDLMVKDKDGNTTIIEIMHPQNTYKAKIAASDGSFNKEITLTDSDIEKINALPDVEDI